MVFLSGFTFLPGMEPIEIMNSFLEGVSMKTPSKLFSVVLILALVLTIFSFSPASSNSSMEKVRVMIQYKAGQKAPVSQFVANAGAEVHYEFDELDTLVITIPTVALQGIERNPNVIFVEEDPLRYLVQDIPPQEGLVEKISDFTPQDIILPSGQTIPYGIDLVQARQVWDQNLDGAIDPGAPTGSGKLICIIDSGLYTAHEDFAGVTIVGGWPTSGTYPYNSDGLGHGTHVAGTIAAMNNNLGVVGVTPGTVNLFVVRVFNDSGGWVNASSLVAAANQCRDNGADIISMSLSGPRASRAERLAFDGYYNTNGILSIAAASNDGTKDLAYPASYDSVISVGALDESMAWADFSNYNAQVELSAPGVDVTSTVPFIETNSVTIGTDTWSANHIEFSARGTATGLLVSGGLCATAGAWSGKVVLCERGTNSFYQKVNAVQTGGGVAALIYNNAPGNFLGTLDPETSTIIGLSLSQEDGQYLLANHLNQSTSVYSHVAFPQSGYEAWSGTSMATPHVSAVAALVWSCSPDLTNIELRTALDNTALDLGTAGRDVYYGFGLVQAKAACDSILPTAIDLISFTATPAKRSIVLNWETASEIDNLGFNIYRATSETGPRTKLNDSLIRTDLPLGSFEGSIYTYVDTNLKFRTVYYYWLEDVDIYLTTTLYGPASAMPLK